MPGDLTVVVNSAGCGSTMKEYWELLGHAGGAAFGARVKDLSQFLLAEGLVEALGRSPGLSERVTYHDACHLAHGQRITSEPRQLIDAIPRIQHVPLPESDMCCGSAGIYNITQPQMARTLLDRKFDHIKSTDALIVATGNPGCHAWIAQAAREQAGESVHVLHTAELLEASFIGLNHFLPKATAARETR
jgi:glycolate oxidase iron-sulfur subunit